MTALEQKLLRDVWRHRGQLAAIAVVLACGVATFVMSVSTMESLERARAAYYDRYRFADVFTSLKRAPKTLEARIAEIPGVAVVETRVVVAATLDLPDLVEPASARLVSVPEHRRPRLNDLHLRSGRWLEPGRPDEAMVAEAFAAAHELRPGDHVTAVVRGRRVRFTIVGVVLSPEHVYQIRPGELIPDYRRFGVFWIGEDGLAAASGLEGAFDDVSLRLARGASEPAVRRRLDAMLLPYGGTGAYGRDEQASHQFVSSEMKQLRAMTTIVPSIFLGVASFLLNVALGRLVATERSQIATLKAFGYRGREIAAHYAMLVLLVVLAGTAVGAAAGGWLGRGLARLYAHFFRFPSFEYRLDPIVLVVALGCGALAAAAGTLAAVWRASRLAPAEAMRPESPPVFRPTLVERLGIAPRFSTAARMVLRAIERRPLRSALSCLGIALAVAVLILGSFSEDAVDDVLEFQFSLSERGDVTLTFVEPSSASALHEVAHLPGVRRAESFRSVPTRLRAGHRSRRVGVLGLAREGELFRLLDEDRRQVVLPPSGLVVSAKLAEILGARPGDVIAVEVLEGERPTRDVVLAGVTRDFAGTAAYMDRRALHRMMREGEVASGAFLAVDRARIAELHHALKDTPRVAGVSVKAAVLASFERTLAENLLLIRSFNVIFAGIIAFGVVYNAARIALSERAHELATLRVLGFTRAEISAILLGELGTLVAAAIPLGMALGYGFAALMVHALESETQRFPLVVRSSTFAWAGLVVFAAAALSAMIVRRRLDRLDLVAALKAGE